jgi:hypothetical protein
MRNMEVEIGDENEIEREGERDMRKFN